MQDMNQLAQEFAPLYSYKLPAWWQTLPGLITIGALSVTLLVLVAVGVWYQWFYHPPLTLEQWHTKEFKALRALLAREQVNYKQFFGAATFVFKQYLLRLYGWNVLDKTDEELWTFVTMRPEIPVALHEPIKKLLSYAQMVKFADESALAESTNKALDTLEEIVNTLRSSTIRERKTNA